VNVHIAIQGPVGKAIQQVLNLFGEHSYTDFENAKLVLVDSKEELLRLHTSDKYFVVLSVKEPSKLPANSEWQGMPELAKLIPLISDEAAIDRKLGKTTSVSGQEVPIERILGGGFHILVVDDSKENRKLAKQLLDGHTLSVASSYGQAMEVLTTGDFPSVVLTDLYLPMSRHGALSVDAIEIGRLVPYGLLIALEAARNGADVAIVTDANHHQDCISAAFDTMRHTYSVNGKKLLLLNNCGKDWAKALELLRK